jgi:hypothetical protein
MTDWQITAKTIYCDAVDDEVTLLVYRDTSCRCTGQKKYDEPDAVTRSAVKEKNRKLSRPVQCERDKCLRLAHYKDSILSEEGN